MKTILVVDNDYALADVVAFTLRRSGFNVLLAHDGEAALTQFTAGQPDLIVLDWGLPKLDGVEVCRRIRAQSDVPIIMLTVRDTDEHVVTALEAGADDYVTKPFSPRRLVARVRAALRRSGGEPKTILTAKPLTLDTMRNIAMWEEQEIHLTHLETRLLQALMQNANQVMTVDNLIARVWGPDAASRDMLKQLVYRLRNKIEPPPPAPRLIENILKVGYVFTPPENEEESSDQEG